jgi:tRNA threonylcarbamoyladenosine biosynthesis protein TsaB
MLFLVTDTSGKQGSIALARTSEPDRNDADGNDVEVIEVAFLAGGMFSAQLVPQLAALLSRHLLSKTDIDAFIVVSGPGSFTGLRVGLAAIKALAEILKKPIVPVSLLEVVAIASRVQGKIVALLDAGRNNVYAGVYQAEGEAVHVLQEELLSKAALLLLARESTVATPDLTLAVMARDANLSVVQVEPSSAEMITRFGLRKLQAGETVSPEQLEANYMRRSDAEMFVKTSF